MQQPTRFPWNSFLPVYLHAAEGLVRKHPAYAAAKAGNAVAAMDLVSATVSERLIEQLWKRFDALAPVLVSVHAVESVGLNAIPDALAWIISASLSWPRELRVIQSNKVTHTGASGFERLQRQALFSGPVLIGLNYILVDDFVAQGGTLANLRGHILAQNGYVIGATVLTGKRYSADLALGHERLQQLRRQHGQLEYWWRQRFGFGFECLTASEARYLCHTATAENIITGLEAAAGSRRGRITGGES